MLNQYSHFYNTVNLYEHKKLLPQNSDLRIAVDKVKPFILGLSLFKKIGNSTKNFNPKNAVEFPPENCGFKLRYFQLTGNCIEVRKDKKVEMRIAVSELNKILINPQLKHAITKYKENISTRPNSHLLINKQKSEEANEFVCFQLVLEKSCLDLIANNYMTYISFADGIEELLRYKKNKSINEFLFHCHNN